MLGLETDASDLKQINECTGCRMNKQFNCTIASNKLTWLQGNIKY